MTTRTAKHLSDMEFDEISLVDRPANQYAKVAIAKRAPEEGAVTYFDEQGGAVDIDTLEPGAVVYDESGQAYKYELDEDEQVDELDLGAGVSKSLADQVREDLSKALGDIERDEIIAKALEEVSKADERIAVAEAIAKSERDLRLTREYTEVAKSYGVPVAAEELGPVLMRAAESLSYEDCAVIHKALSAAGAIFDELGANGVAEVDVLREVDSLLDTDVVSKSVDGGLSREAAISKAFEENPRAYDEYLASRRG